MKKIISLILALTMVLSMSVCAFATDTTITKTGDATVTGESDVVLKGTVTTDAVLLSVVMPTTLTFQVSTVASNSGDKLADNKGTISAIPTTTSGFIFNDLVSGTGTVTNNSNRAIKLEVAGVTDKGDLTTKMDLGITSTDLNEKNALANPLDASADYTTSPLALANSIAANGGTASLSVVGAAGTATLSADTYAVNLVAGDYTVTTTMKVSIAA